MENALKVNLKEIFYTVIVLSIISIGFILFIQFTQQSVNTSIVRGVENQNNHAIFAVSY